MNSRKDWRSRLASAILTDPTSCPQTEVLLSLDEVYARKVIDLAMRIAEAQVAVGAPANDVALSTIRVAAALGIKPVHVDITYNSIGVSYHRDESDLPFTLIRVVRVPVPDHSKLQSLQALVVDIEAGLGLDEARSRFHAIRRIPFLYQPSVIVLAQGALTVGVAFLYGASWLIGLIAFLAACSAAIVIRMLNKLHVPYFFLQAVGALVVTAFAVATNWLGILGVPYFESARPSIIVAAGIVLLLSGMQVVGAAQDAIDGFALTALGRILDLALLTLGAVIGISAGVSIAQSLGVGFVLDADAPPLGSIVMQFVGVAIITIAVAVWNGARFRTIAFSAGVSLIAWLSYSVAAYFGASVALASGVGALFASVIGMLIGQHLHVPSIAVTTAAIVPMVPGAMVLRGILQIAESDGDSQALIIGVTELVGAGAVGIALASGASLGLFLGAPIRDTLQSVVRRRSRIR